MLALQPLVPALRQLGVDTGRVLARAGLTLAELEDSNARIAAGFEYTLWDAAEEVTGDPCIALRVADQVPLGTLGAYEYLLHNSATLRTTIERAARYAPLIDESLLLALVEDGGAARLRFSRVGVHPFPPQTIECTFAVTLKLLSDELTGDAHPMELRFTHERRGPLEERTRRFGCPVRFEQPHNEIVFSAEALDRPRAKADTRLGNVLEQHVQHTLATIPTHDPFVQKAKRALADGLANGNASLETLAKQMHMSARTLRRQLEAQGTSYKDLLDELRKELSFHYLTRSSESFDEIARRLGFSESSAFYRAFKRWAGTTPAAYREEQRPL